jgi:hypothetical protein
VFAYLLAIYESVSNGEGEKMARRKVMVEK